MDSIHLRFYEQVKFTYKFVCCQWEQFRTTIQYFMTIFKDICLLGSSLFSSPIGSIKM